MSHVFKKLGLALAGCAVMSACGPVDGEEGAKDVSEAEPMATQQSELLSGDCTGIRPNGPGPRIVNKITVGPDVDCVSGTSDSAGHMALGTFVPFSDVATYRVQEETGGPTLGTFGGYQLFDILPSFTSFQAFQHYPDNTAYLLTWNHNGSPVSTTRLDQGSLDSSRMFDMESDYGGGVVFAYGSRDNFHNHFYVVTMQRFFQGGAPRHDRVIVAASPNQPTFIVAGVNWTRHALVVYDGMMEGFGYGHIAAAWFNSDGVRLTSAFDIGMLANPGASHSFRLFPLYDGQMVLRVDGNWTYVIPTSPGPGTAPPAWLASHPNTDLHFIRNYRGYALAPHGFESVPACYQRFYLYAQNGNYCGSATFGVDSDPCVTNSIALGKDGTVIQTLPTSRETCSSFGPCTCTRYIYQNVLQ